MKNIKFRAWDKSENTMRDVRSILNFNNEGYVIVEAQESFYGLPFGGNFNRLELMQFTGFVDKNGKEIYEGDIIETEKDDCNYIKYIVWGQKGGWHPVHTYCDNLYEFLHDMGGKNVSEVIGNIYENKELKAKCV